MNFIKGSLYLIRMKAWSLKRMEEYLVTITAQESGIEYFQICKYGIDNSYPISKKRIVPLIITQLRICSEAVSAVIIYRVSQKKW